MFGRNWGDIAHYHPLVHALFFILVMAGAMCFMSPIYLCISFCCALVCATQYSKIRARYFFVLLPAALINPAFNHRGATILCYLPSGNPLTMESILYGIATAAMLGTVIAWCAVLQELITSDELLYLSGRILPGISLMLSISLRFVPQLKQRATAIATAQRALTPTNGHILKRIKNGITILSVLVTWSLESALETADSMHSRGFGLHGRTAFSIFKPESRDYTALLILGVLGIYLLVAALLGQMSWSYFPILRATAWTPYSVSAIAAYILLCAMPILAEGSGQWISTKSKP